MDNEVSQSMSITVQLVVVSFIVGLMTLFSVLSQDFSRNSVTTVADIQKETYASELRDAASEIITPKDHMITNFPIPAPSAFAILLHNADSIHELSGIAYGVTIQKSEDLRNILDKKVKIKLTQYLDMYDVEIQEE